MGRVMGGGEGWMGRGGGKGCEAQWILDKRCF